MTVPELIEYAKRKQLVIGRIDDTTREDNGAFLAVGIYLQWEHEGKRYKFYLIPS